MKWAHQVKRKWLVQKQGMPGRIQLVLQSLNSEMHNYSVQDSEKYAESFYKDLGHFWLGYIRIMIKSWDTCHRVLT